MRSAARSPPWRTTASPERRARATCCSTATRSSASPRPRSRCPRASRLARPCWRSTCGYPRPPIDDALVVCDGAGVDAVYAQSEEAMYPSGYATTVDPGNLATRLEGAARPGHFAGVATVVTKLFTALRPDLAVFGAKDFQQLA